MFVRPPPTLGESPRTPEPSPPSPETAPRSRVAHILKPAGAAAPNQPAIEVDGLLAFDPHLKAGYRAVEPKVAPQPQPTPSGRGRFWLAITAAIVTTAAVTFGLTATPTAASWLSLLQSRWTAPPLARLTITTRPDGAQVSIDGEARGVTPLTLSVNPGPHTLAVRTGGQERVVPITAAAGADIVRDFEMTAITPPVTGVLPITPPVTGVLSITTEPPGARIAVDGKPSGTSPVTLDALAAGKHTIAVTGATGSAGRTVTVVAGQTASVVFSLPKVAGPVGGWLSVSVPFEVQVVERGEVIGASGGARIMLAAGRHDLVLVNRTLEYLEPRQVEVVAGQTTVVRVDPPTVHVNVNARPWAEVSIDGRDLGQTPIANIAVTVGTHEIVFRHPQFGERRQTVVVTSREPQRIAVDMTK